MTVKEAILLLQKMPDDSVKLLIDCPFCGRGNQLESIDKCVVLGSTYRPSPTETVPPAGERGEQ